MVVIKKLIIVLAFVFIVSLFSVSAQDYLALQGSVTGATTGNVVVEIWSAPTGGTLLYNSSNDFNNVISSSRYDILVGNGTQPLSLNFSGTYYMNLNIAGKDMDFNGSDRQVFQSPVGNITTSRPIKTYSTSASALNVNDKLNISGLDGNVTTGGNVLITSTDTDDALNVSAGGANIFGNTVISGKATLQSTDADDALNVSLGGLTVAGGSPGDMPFKVANNGAVQIKNDDPDYALNVTGGSYFWGGATISGRLIGNDANKDFSWDGKVSFTNNDADDALNISNGGMYVSSGPDYFYFNPGAAPPSAIFSIKRIFNVSTFGDVTSSGTVTILSTDPDDALNVTGAVRFGGNPMYADRFTVDGNGNVNIRSSARNALNVSSGGAFIQGNTSIWGDTVVVGNPNPPGTNMQNHITIRDGKGPDKCAYLELYDEGGQPWAIWINTTGDMRISNNPPANCSISGEGVGSQP